jgi:hypothetical protein
MVDDRPKDTPSTDYNVAARYFDFEHEALSVDLGELGLGDHGSSGGHSLEVIDFDAGTDSEGSWRKNWADYV